jgi:hypothetical protein
MTATTLNSKSLGNVETINMIKNANIESIPLPKKNSAQTKLFDFNGATKSITVSGSFTATSVGAVKTLVDDIESLINGNQLAIIPFYSDLTGTIYVFVQSFQWDWNVSISQAVASYTLELIQGVKGGQ